MSSELQCPRCGSNQITANKKGFSGRNAIAGAFLTGGIGLLAGTIGSNKVKITCLACGNIFNPGEGKIVSNSMNTNNSFETQFLEKPKYLVNKEKVNFYRPIAPRNVKSVSEWWENEIKKEQNPTKKKHIEEMYQRILKQKKELRLKRLLYSAIIVLIAAFPLISLFKKSLHSDFGFFIIMLFIFGMMVTIFILKIIWDMTE